MENVETIRSTNMKVDTMFDSFSALEKLIDNFQKRNRVQFIVGKWKQQKEERQIEISIQDWCIQRSFIVAFMAERLSKVKAKVNDQTNCK